MSVRRLVTLATVMRCKEAMMVKDSRFGRVLNELRELYWE